MAAIFSTPLREAVLHHRPHTPAQAERHRDWMRVERQSWTAIEESTRSGRHGHEGDSIPLRGLHSRSIKCPPSRPALECFKLYRCAIMRVGHMAVYPRLCGLGTAWR